MITIKRLNEIYKEELQKAIDLGIPLPLSEMPSEITTMKATSKYGDCHWDNSPESKKNIRIRISQYHLPNGEEAVRQTIAHEICHAAPGNGHGAEWKKWANMFNEKYGYHIERLGTFKAGHQLKSRKKKPIIKHKVVCCGCGYVFKRTRRSNLTEHPEWYSCAKCGGKLKLEY